MPVPKKRQSRMRRDSRRANHDKVKNVPNYVACSNPSCREPSMSHRVCPHCGWYKGRLVVAVKSKAAAEAAPAEEKK